MAAHSIGQSIATKEQVEIEGHVGGKACLILLSVCYVRMLRSSLTDDICLSIRGNYHVVPSTIS